MNHPEIYQQHNIWSTQTTCHLAEMSIKMLSEQVEGSRRELYVAYRTHRTDITNALLLQRQCSGKKVSDARYIHIMKTRVFIII